MDYKSLDSYQTLSGDGRDKFLLDLLEQEDFNWQVSWSTFFLNRASDRYFLNEKPLTPWILSQVEGKILAAHCDCMAELGEACSHVAYLLWVISLGVEKRDSLTGL